MLAWFIPITVRAQEVLVPQVVKLMQSLNKHVINPLVKVLFVVALLVFAWGVIEFFLAKQTNESLEQGRQHMLWGIVGMAIMGGVFGIMYFIISTLGVTYIH